MPKPLDFTWFPTKLKQGAEFEQNMTLTPNNEEVKVSIKALLHRQLPFLKMLVFLQISVHEEPETHEL